MQNILNTLIAVAVINRTDDPISAREAGRYGAKVRDEVAAVADLVVVIDAQGITADAAVVTSSFELEDGNTAFRVSNKPVPANIVGLDFSEIIGTSPFPSRLLEIDVDGAGNVAAAGVLTAPTIKSAKLARAPRPVHVCGADAFYGPCRAKVAEEGAKCAAHAGHLCGVPSISDGRPCRMAVAKKGAVCALHAHLVPAKGRGKKAVA